MKKGNTISNGYKQLIKKMNNEIFLMYALFAIAPFSIGSGIVLVFNLTSHKLLFEFLLHLGFFIAAMNAPHIPVSEDFKKRLKHARE